MGALYMTERRRHLYEHAIMKASLLARMIRNDFADGVLGAPWYQVTKEQRIGDVIVRHSSFYPPRRHERSVLVVLHRGRTVFRVRYRRGTAVPLVDRRGAWEKAICKEGMSCSWIYRNASSKAR